ncbi:MAG: serine/threonine protein kinase, partial [Coleofasciculaceae cyanobacterium]
RLITCLRTLSGGHSNLVLDVAISQDWKTVVGASSDAAIEVWNLSTGKLRRTLHGHLGAVHSVAISPDGQTIVS